MWKQVEEGPVGWIYASYLPGAQMKTAFYQDKSTVLNSTLHLKLAQDPELHILHP